MGYGNWRLPIDVPVLYEHRCRKLAAEEHNTYRHSYAESQHQMNQAVERQQKGVEKVHTLTKEFEDDEHREIYHHHVRRHMHRNLVMNNWDGVQRCARNQTPAQPMHTVPPHHWHRPGSVPPMSANGYAYRSPTHNMR